MGQKKNKNIILIIIMCMVILILLAGGAYIYFATDIFKSKKDLFLKYFTQIGDEKQGFIETTLKDYFEKQKNTPYTNEGTATVNITDSMNQQKFEDANNINLTFAGQVNTANAQRTQVISLNYSDSVKFPLTYKQIGNTIGIQTDYIGSKYIATNTQTTDSLTDQIKNIQKVQQLLNIELNQKDWQYLKETYFNILVKELQDNNFSRVEEGNSKGYRVTFNGENLKNITTKLLETLKNDQTMLEKINEYLKAQKNSSNITASTIDNFIKEMNNNSELNEVNLQITVYQEKQKTKKIVINMNDMVLQIEKNITGNSQQYVISLGTNQQKGKLEISLIVSYSGLQSLQSISENYELKVQYGEQNTVVTYQYNWNNNIEFTDNINIVNFSNNDTIMLNELEEEQRNTFVTAIEKRIQSVNKNQMQKLGLEEDGNPLQYIIPTLGSDFSSINAMNQNHLSEEEISTFNSKFENYASNNLKGVTVKGLLSTIQLNNESQEDKNKEIKEIHLDGEEYEATEQNITLLKSSIEVETAYRVEFEKDEHMGMIYRVVINKK